MLSLRACRRVLAVGILCSLAIPANAAVIALWNAGIGGATENNSTAASDILLGINASTIGRSTGSVGFNNAITGTGVTFAPSGDRVFRQSGWNHSTPTNYYTISTDLSAPNTGFGLDLTDISFYAALSGTNTARTGSIRIDWRIDNQVDGSNNPIWNTGNVFALPNSLSYTQYTQPLNIIGASEVDFRIYLYNAGSENNVLDGSASIGLDDIQVNGAIMAIPEPSLVALAGLGGFLTLGVMLRTRSAARRG